MGKRVESKGRNFGLIIELKFKAARIYLKLILMEMFDVYTSQEVVYNYP
jgi:hypothetical protein